MGWIQMVFECIWFTALRLWRCFYFDLKVYRTSVRAKRLTITGEQKKIKIEMLYEITGNKTISCEITSEWNSIIFATCSYMNGFSLPNLREISRVWILRSICRISKWKTGLKSFPAKNEDQPSFEFFRGLFFCHSPDGGNVICYANKTVFIICSDQLWWQLLWKRRIFLS